MQDLTLVAKAHNWIVHCKMTEKSVEGELNGDVEARRILPFQQAKN
jgi:hypothetical protein